MAKNKPDGPSEQTYDPPTDSSMFQEIVDSIGGSQTQQIQIYKVRTSHQIFNDSELEFPLLH